MAESACKKRRISPVAFRFMDLPVDVVRVIQDKLYDATTRLRLQSVIPKAMWAVRPTDSQLSLIEYCKKRDLLVENKCVIAFLFDRTERSAREILESMEGYQTFVRVKNLKADIAAERLRDPSELPSASEIAADFDIPWDVIKSLGDRSLKFFDEFVATDMFRHMIAAFPRGGYLLYEAICSAKNEALYHRVRDLARDDPRFNVFEKNLETRVFEAKMNGDRDADVLELFKTAASSFNMYAARSMFDRVSKIPV
jgi:hypothetical protein